MSAADPAREASAVPSGARPGSLAVGLLVGIGTAAMGVLFCVLLWRGYEKAREMGAWVETPAHVLVADIEPFHPTPHSPEAYRLRLEYAYDFGGRPFTSSRYKRIDGPSNHRKKIEAIIKRVPAGSDVVCFVDPDDPATAVLRRDSRAPLYTIWFPGLFVVGGLGIAFGSLRQLVRRLRR